MSPGMPLPTLETQRGFEDLIERLNLTHAQREHVEQIMTGEALQLQKPAGIPISPWHAY